MAYVESYGGLDQELRGICGFQNTRVPGSPKKSPHQIAGAAQTGFLVFKYFKLRSRSGLLVSARRSKLELLYLPGVRYTDYQELTTRNFDDRHGGPKGGT